MNRTDAARLARKLMNEHGLTDVTFQFDRAKRRFGACKWRRHGVIITLSEVLLPHRSDGEIRDTILHEIAHAIAGHSAGHGPKWKATARRIGAKPERCSSLTKEARAKVSKYVAKCAKGCTEHHFNRMGRRWRRDGYICSKCRGKLKVTQLR